MALIPRASTIGATNLQRSTCWNADGTVDICSYDEGRPVGQGVVWSADLAQAWEVQDGEKGRSISLEEAAQIAARIGLPVPPADPEVLARIEE